jgi:hypothetical protein
MKLFLNKNLAFVIVFFWSTVAISGPIPPPPSTTPPPPGLPVDGAIFLLALVALVYGLYKMRQFHKKQNASD